MANIKEYNIEAVYIAKGINLAKTEEKLDKNLIGRRREFLTYLLGEREFLFIFSFGALVFVNIEKETQSSIRRSLSKFMENPVRGSFEESYALREEEKKFEVGNDSAVLPVVRTGEIEIAARILAQSVALDYVEELTDEMIANIESMNAELEKGSALQNPKPILHLFAQNASIVQFVISKLSLLDKPEITWDEKRLETFFSQLADLFELRSRFRNVEYKIGFARENSEFALTVIQGRRDNFLEVVIIILIIIDIALYFFGG